MVQLQGSFPPQGRSFPSRDSTWTGECPDRSFLNANHQETRFAPAPVLHPRVLPVESALKECAGISVREFALFVVDEHGIEKTYSSSQIAPYQERFFDDRFRSNFRRSLRRSSKASMHDGEYRTELSAGSSSDNRRRMRRVSLSDSDEGGAGHSSIRQRKRSRPSLFGHYAEPEVTAIPVQTQRYQQLVIGDELEVEKFYYQRFRDLQQNACKHIGKAFVKLVEPKKQTHFPYTRGSEAAPSWWPLEPGPDKKERVPHREPDHLLKPQRVRLLVHILRMVIQPYDQQHPSAQKLRLNVKKLEDAALEVMTPWFNDKEKTDNANKRVFFKEIFKVAKQEERFKNGEIDGSTRIPIMSGDRNISTDDESEDEGMKDEDDEELGVIHTPDGSPGIISGDLQQHLSQPQSEPVSTSFQQLPGTRHIPVRQYSAPQQHMESPSHGTFPDSSYLSLPAVQERPSFHSSPPGIYGWQSQSAVTSNIVSASNGPNSYYVSAPSQTSFQLPPPTSVNMLPPPLSIPHYDTTSQRFEGVGRQHQSHSIQPQNQVTQHQGPSMHHGLSEYYHDTGYTHDEHQS